MTKANAAAPTLMARVSSLWARFWDHLNVLAQRETAAWGSTLQYKRRYTNPDDAKRYRRPIEEM